MIKLELSAEQASVLRDTLESVLSDLSYEIANTDQKDFREGLKARRAALQDVRERLDTDGRGADASP